MDELTKLLQDIGAMAQQPPVKVKKSPGARVGALLGSTVVFVGALAVLLLSVVGIIFSVEEIVKLL